MNLRQLKAFFIPICFHQGYYDTHCCSWSVTKSYLPVPWCKALSKRNTRRRFKRSGLTILIAVWTHGQVQAVLKPERLRVCLQFLPGYQFCLHPNRATFHTEWVEIRGGTTLLLSGKSVLLLYLWLLVCRYSKNPGVLCGAGRAIIKDCNQQCASLYLLSHEAIFGQFFLSRFLDWRIWPRNNQGL